MTHLKTKQPKREFSAEVKKRIRNIRILSAFTGVILILSFQNCAQNFTAVNVEGSIDLASLSGGMAFEKSDLNLMSANQVLEGLVVATQTTSISNAQRDEFNRRRGSFSDMGDPESVNAPYMFSLASLAGPFCEGLVNRERAVASEERRYFASINFAVDPRQMTDDQFLASAGEFSASHWRDSLSEEEKSVLLEFKNSFLQGVTTINATQTQNLMIALCSAMLANVTRVVY